MGFLRKFNFGLSNLVSDPSIPELVHLDDGEAVLLDAEDLDLLYAEEAVLLDAEDLVLLDAGEAVLLDAEDLVILDAGEPVLLDAYFLVSYECRSSEVAVSYTHLTLPTKA